VTARWYSPFRDLKKRIWVRTQWSAGETPASPLPEASLGGANCLSRRVCRCASKEKIKIELLEAQRERERERELQLWHLQGAFPSSSFLIVADYLSLHHPTQVCFFFSAAAAVVLSSVSSHVWRLLSHLLLSF
jgi:hypothetical protein